MARIDLYGPVHKALRSELYEVARGVARTDFAKVEESGRTVAAIQRLVGFLDEHAEHEDEVLMPELAAVAPELFADLEADHARVEGLHRDLAALAARLQGATEVERVALGTRLHERVVRIVAEQLRHMDREEHEAQPALWANRTDAELEAMHGRILAAIPPPRMAEWLGIMLPAISMPERAGMLGGMREQVPAPVLEVLTAPARAALGAQAWAETAAAAGF